MTLPSRCPDALRGIRAWLLWRFEPNPGGGKPRKIPYYATGGRRTGKQGSPDDTAQLVDWNEALRAAAVHDMAGVGFALDVAHNVTALDFDNCYDGDRLLPDVAALVQHSYAERSPSKRGVRAFFVGQLGNLKDHGAPFGFEVFSSKGFVTVTGDVLPLCVMADNENTVAPLHPSVLAYAQQRFKRTPTEPEHTSYGAEPIGLSATQIQAALAALPAELDYDTWVQVGMALHHETQGEGFNTWDEWSSYSPKYTTREYGLERWASFGRNQGEIVTARSLVRLANEHGADIDIHAPATAEDFDHAGNEANDEDDSGFQVVGPAAKAEKPLRFRPVPLAVFAQRAAPGWLVKRLIPKAELVVLFGESGSGKSFMAFDIAVKFACGQPWRGLRTKGGRVVYIAAEGAGGFRNRVVAYGQANGVALTDIPIDVIDTAPNLLLKDDALDVVRGIGRADLVIVDTWAQVTPGGNENAGEDMGKALAHCKGIHRATGATVLLVHHSGKDASKGARGWSGLRAAADAELEVIRLANGRLLRTSKQKDGDDGLEWGFGLDVVEIGRDEDDEPITSCVVVEQEVPVARLMRVLGPLETLVNAVLQEFAKVQNRGIEVTAVIVEVVKRMPAPEDGKRDTRKQRARKALEALCAGGEAMYELQEDGTIDIL
jgi:hypothetical protein